MCSECENDEEKRNQELWNDVLTLDEWYKKQKSARLKEMPLEVKKAWDNLSDAVKNKKCPEKIYKYMLGLNILKPKK